MSRTSGDSSLRAALNYLPAFAVMGVAVVYVRAWVIFRNFDPQWLTQLSAADIFTMGWAMSPTLIVGGLFGLYGGNQLADFRGDKKQAVELSSADLVLVRLSSLLLALLISIAVQLLAGPLFVRLQRWSALALIAAALLSIFFICAGAVKERRGQTAMIAKFGGGLAAFLLLTWDYEGYLLKRFHDETRVRFNNGQAICRVVVFTGREAVFLWSERDGAVSVSRSLVAAFADKGGCPTPADNPRRLTRPPAA